MGPEIELLAKPLEAWVRARGWKSLQPVQSEAIKAILQSTCPRDFVLSATTASGKTEAAFLPLLTRIHARSAEPLPSFEILYLSPLKALINDMIGRVTSMAKCVKRSAYRRHGDIRGAERAGSSGILLTTPESLEAQFIRSPDTVGLAFKDLQAVIVDEVHAYFESPRGPQLISLLARLEARLARELNGIEHRIDRIALSATVSGGEGEASLRSFLRPGDPGSVEILCPSGVPNRLKVYLRVFRETPPKEKSGRERVEGASPIEVADSLNQPRVLEEMTRSLYDVFSKVHKGLIFTNSRQEAENVADLLNSRAREEKLVKQPREEEEDYSPATRRFWPHHGSLDSSIRSRAEKEMRDEKQQSVLVCTSTLELGIDIGTVEATAQIGPGYSVASLRQRLGRSGRREGQIPTLYAYVREPDDNKELHPVERLRLRTFRTIAQINLLERGVFEPADLGRFHLSTLIQQLLSSVHDSHDEDGLDPKIVQETFAEKGPFGSAKDLLEPLIDHLLLKYNAPIEEQHGKLFLTEWGKRYVEHFQFYAAFNTPEEYLVRAGSRRIGSFAPRYTYGPGDQFLFAGTFWEVLRVDHMRHVMEVKRSFGGRAPHFQGDALAPSDLVVHEMRDLYSADKKLILPQDANAMAREVTKQGRSAYRELFKEDTQVIEYGDTCLLFPWVGARKQTTVLCALKWLGLSASAMDAALCVRDVGRKELLEKLRRLLGTALPKAHDLARYASKLTFEKHDYLLSPTLKRMNFASAKLDVDSLPGTIERLLDSDRSQKYSQPHR